jgi:NADPH2:quinone reductase
MRAVVMTATGGPEVLVAGETPEPSPAAGQVLVRVEAIGTHFAETLLRRGGYPMPTPPPVVFGTQAVGVVAEVGAEVDPDWVGARVAAGAGSGAYAEYLVAESSAITPVLDELSSVDAAAVAMPGSVAVALLAAAGPVAGQTVLVEAGASGVGGYLTQLVRHQGAGVVAVTASATSAGHARKLGADIVIDAGTADWPRALSAHPDCSTLDVVFESIGGASARRVLEHIRPGGRMVHYGLLGGEPAAVGATDLMAAGVTLIGCGGPAFHAAMAAARRTALEWAAQGRITPLVDSTLPLARAAEAHRRIEARGRTGTVVLVP